MNFGRHSFSAPDGKAYPAPRPSMRGRYLIRNRLAASFMGALDLVFDNLLSTNAPAPRNPRRILVCNWAHLGDVLLTLPAVDWLQERFPKAELGFLGGSWASPILADVGARFSQVHIIDHFNLSRSGDLAERLRQHRHSAAIAIADIRRAGYDMAIDFYPFFPAPVSAFGAQAYRFGSAGPAGASAAFTPIG